MISNEWLANWELLFGSFNNMWQELPRFIIVAARAAVMYVVGLFIIRIGKNRLLGRTTAFDIVLAFILGSLFSRAINGTAPLASTVTAGLTLVLLHWLIACTASRWKFIDRLVKGPHRDLIRDGCVQYEEMEKAEVSAQDLEEALRLRAGLKRANDVELACLERNGEISAVPMRGTSQVVDVEVVEGIQRIRIEVV